MAEPFLSEIRLFSFNFAPKGWALCNGQLLPINQNQPLFALLGTTYGGNGQTTFALPNLRGRTPIHVGAGHTLGEAAGATAVTLTVAQMPTHVHGMQAKAANASLVGGAIPGSTKAVAQAIASTGATPTAINLYSSNTANVSAMNPGSISNTGGSQPHNNMMPYLTLNYCIALQGIFPSRN
jgi:microcystin-dependent protein